MSENEKSSIASASVPGPASSGLTRRKALGAAAAVGATPHEVAGYSLLASLVALGLLEHWFMVLPVPADALWRWGLASRSAAQREGRPAPAPVA